MGFVPFGLVVKKKNREVGRDKEGGGDSSFMAPKTLWAFYGWSDYSVRMTCWNVWFYGAAVRTMVEKLVDFSVWLGLKARN
ncbi:conserved hypothetical protein [Ricinus communis]|uniref:Uncharacterized protein n=1 Tax=Ricinus communis TaxID=3988 RepID=B9RFK3_RICCO|nr:conserved hypothetical protein [Ricinus communis]